MKVLVIGGGGREHALCWKLAQSSALDRVYCAPGNDGMAEVAETVELPADDIPGLRHFARDNGVELTVVGPEVPLSMGIVDDFRREGLRIVGPTRQAAQLESSKRYAKELMHKHSIPTADFEVHTHPDGALRAIEGARMPIVVKADGLAAGKGVLICQTEAEAEAAIRSLMVERDFGDAGRTIVLEEFLEGRECSALALTDGSTIAPLATAQDYKRIRSGDEGPNTGGMGAVSPALMEDSEREPLLRTIDSKILIPIIHACRRVDHPFEGILYAGLMRTPAGPRVLEFNVRFGDPETQPILMRLKSDLFELLDATERKTLDRCTLEWDPRPAVCVVVASEGYPTSSSDSVPIQGLDNLPTGDDAMVFHAGTSRRGDRWYATGGRVLGVTALGDTVEKARNRAYELVRRITFQGMQYRDDIAAN